MKLNTVLSFIAFAMLVVIAQLHAHLVAEYEYFAGSLLERFVPWFLLFGGAAVAAFFTSTLDEEEEEDELVS